MVERMTRAQQQQITRKHLLDAAEILFGERGIHQTSLDEVARKAGLTKGAIYANFASKNDLVAGILERKLAAIDEPSPTEARPASWIEALSRDYEAAIDRPENQRFVHAFVEFWLYGMREDTIRTELVQWLQAVRNSNVRQAKALLGDDLPLPPDQFAVLMLALDIGVSLQRLLDPAAVPAASYEAGLNALLRRDLPVGQP